MKIQVSEIPAEGMEIYGEDVISVEDVVLTGPVKSELHVLKAGEEVVISGRLDAGVRLQCSRCLAEFEGRLDIPVETVYAPSPEAGGESERELGGDELNTAFYEGDVIDTDEIAREQVLLSIPIKPLCREDCGGLCPRCGADMNKAPCGCAGKAAHPGMEALKDYFRKGDLR